MNYFLIIDRFMIIQIISAILIFLQNNFQILIRMIKINSFLKKIKRQSSSYITVTLIKFFINLILNYLIQ